MTASSHRPPGIVVGLRAEARIAAKAWPNAIGAPSQRCAFGDPAQVTALIETGVPALVSFGLAGGLDPGLAPGTLVLADSVLLPNGDVVATDTVWRERVRRELAPTLTPVIAPVVGSDDLVGDTDAKARLWKRTAAAAVDMESHTVARAAQRASLAFLVLRAIADPAAGALPPAVRRGFTPGGRLRPIVIIGGAILAPSQLAELWRVAIDARSGLAVLRRAVHALGPQLGFRGRSAA